MENNFYCFGCNAGSNPIDFYMLCTGLDFSGALKELRKRIDPTKATGTARIPVQSNLGELLQVSHLLRKTMLSHPTDLKWISDLMQKVDRHIFDIAHDDVSKAKSLYKAVEKQILERYK